MVMQKQLTTTSEFLAFANAPENADKLFELIEGEIVKKMASFTPSEIAGWILTFLNNYLLKNSIGRASGEAGSYILDDENTFMPDVGYISNARTPERPRANVLSPQISQWKSNHPRTPNARCGAKRRNT